MCVWFFVVVVFLFFLGGWYTLTDWTTGTVCLKFHNEMLVTHVSDSLIFLEFSFSTWIYAERVGSCQKKKKKRERKSL